MRDLHLLNRDGRYWWRRRVPLPVARRIGRTHLAWSLDCTDKSRARRLAMRLTVLTDALFERLRWSMLTDSTIDPETLRKLLHGVYLQVVAEREVRRFEERGFGQEQVGVPVHAAASQAERGAGSTVQDPDGAIDTPEGAAHSGATVADWRRALDENRIEAISPILDPVLRAARIDLDRHDFGYRLLCHQALRVGLAAMQSGRTHRVAGGVGTTATRGGDQRTVAASVRTDPAGCRIDAVVSDEDRRIVAAQPATGAVSPSQASVLQADGIDRVLNLGRGGTEAAIDAAHSDPASSQDRSTPYNLTELADAGEPMDKNNVLTPRPDRGNARDRFGDGAHRAVVATTAVVSTHEPSPPARHDRSSRRSEPADAAPSRRLSEAGAAYRAVKRRERWSGKSDDSAQMALRLAIEFFGDRHVHTLRPADAIAFRDALFELPVLNGKGVFAGLTMADAIARADALEAESLDDGAGPIDADGRIARIGPKTVNKHLAFVKAIVEEERRRADLSTANPFTGVRAKRSKLARASDERKHWTDDELVRLFATPVWTGCKSEERRGEPGNLILRDGRFWVPLLGAYAGLRLEEACQLHVDDLVQLDGVWCFRIAPGNGKLIKTVASKRDIPIHTDLIDVGLLEHRAAVAGAGHRNLFPELPRGGRYKLLGYYFTKWFTRYRRAIGMYEPLRDFHSLRHSFDTHLMNKGCQFQIVQQLLGHEGSTETDKRYFKGFKPQQLSEAIQQLDYGLKLDHLRCGSPDHRRIAA